MCASINFLIVFSMRFALRPWPKKICLRLVSHHNSHHEILVSGLVRKLSVKVSPKSSFVQVCLMVRLIIISHPSKIVFTSKLQHILRNVVMRTTKTRSILRFKGGRFNEIVFRVYLSTLTTKTRLKRLKLKVSVFG